MIEIDWKEVNMTLNGKKINLSKLVSVKFQENSKLDVFSAESLLFHIIIK